jgi:hypothetical protein
MEGEGFTAPRYGNSGGRCAVSLAGTLQEVDSKPAPFEKAKTKGCATQDRLTALRVLHPPALPWLLSLT